MPISAEPKMPGIGVNLRVSFKLSQGGRKYMEDMHISKFTTSENGETQLGFFGVFDGHGGREAAVFVRDNLFQEITEQELFWSECDDDVLKAIRHGFITTHNKMWKELEKWPKRSLSGYQSTAGTTSTVGIIRDKKLYIGHVGDSGIVLGYTDDQSGVYRAKRLTEDHKPETPSEKARIESIGGSVASGKSGIQRVVWNRPSPAHKGPVRRSTQMVQIPFLAVARSLGDLWSYDYNSGQFAVSPEPDLHVMEIDPSIHKCLVIGSDGLWNMLSPEESVSIVQGVEEETEYKFLNDLSVTKYFWINHSRRLVNVALQKWAQHLVRADNTTAITILIDEYGPPKAQRLLAERKKRNSLALKKVIEPEMCQSDVSSDVTSEITDHGRMDTVDGPREPSTPILPSEPETVPASKPYALKRQMTFAVDMNNTPEVLEPVPTKLPETPTTDETICPASKEDVCPNTSRRSTRMTPGKMLTGKPLANLPLGTVKRPVTRGFLKAVPDNHIQVNKTAAQTKRLVKRDVKRPTRAPSLRRLKRRALEATHVTHLHRSVKRAKFH